MRFCLLLSDTRKCFSTSRSGVCWMSQSHRCGALWHQYRSPCCALHWSEEQGYAPLQCLAVTGPMCLGFHHGGAACKTHRPGGAVAENEPWKGDIRPRTASGLGKKRNSVSTNSRRRVDGGRSMWVRRVFRLVACEMVPGQESRCWMWLMKLQMAFMADPLIASSKCKTCK
jgi:hypothetical protein